MSILEVSNVSKSFGGVKANVDISMNVEKGRIVGLIGPNGSGKTTLFNSIVGTYPIDSGSIGICRVDDQLIENISSNLQSSTSMMFYKKIIVKVQKDKVKIFKPRDLSILRDF